MLIITYIHTNLAITTLQAGLQPSLPHHLCRVCQFYTWLVRATVNFHLLSEFWIQTRWEEIVEEIWFHISFCWKCVTWGLKPELPSNKLKHYILNYGDFESKTLSNRVFFIQNLQNNFLKLLLYLIWIWPRNWFVKYSLIISLWILQPIISIFSEIILQHLKVIILPLKNMPFKSYYKFNQLCLATINDSPIHLNRMNQIFSHNHFEGNHFWV